MSIHRRAAKRDASESGIIKSLRAHGCVVWQLSGAGVPDLLVMRAGRTWLADVKMPGKKATKPQEDAWEEAATKARVAVFILRTEADAAAMLNSALPPWEPDAEVMARAIGLMPYTVKGAHKPGTNSRRKVPFNEAMDALAPERLNYAPPRTSLGLPDPLSAHLPWREDADAVPAMRRSAGPGSGSAAGGHLWTVLH